MQLTHYLQSPQYWFDLRFKGNYRICVSIDLDVLKCLFLVGINHLIKQKHKAFDEQKVIFLADNDADDCSFFCEEVEEIDKSVICYVDKNGIGIFNRLSENTSQPDIIFLDINMTVMDGWES